MKFYNTNDAYGQEGPFEADSKEELAAIMEDQIRGWAYEKLMQELGFEDNDPDYDDELVETLAEEMRAEFIDGLRAVYDGEPRVICDNDGGITLQLPGYVHHYASPLQCAEDIKEWLDGDWEGDDEDCRMSEPSETDEVLSVEELLDMSPREANDTITGEAARALYRHFVRAHMGGAIWTLQNSKISTQSFPVDIIEFFDLRKK